MWTLIRHLVISMVHRPWLHRVRVPLQRVPGHLEPMAASAAMDSKKRSEALLKVLVKALIKVIMAMEEKVP